MDTNDNPKAEVRRSPEASERLKMMIGGISILAVALLAGLVYRSYEAGIPPADPEPTSAVTQFIPVTISAQGLATHLKSVPAHSSKAAPRQQAPSVRRPA
jgi:hypothetical protein